MINGALYSQSTQTNKDSVLVATSDLDKAVIKMIQGKECKEQLQAVNSALNSCDNSKNELKTSVLVLNSDLLKLRNVNSNLEANVVNLKKIFKKEKSRGIRRGFFGFLAGALTTVVIISTH